MLILCRGQVRDWTLDAPSLSCAKAKITRLQRRLGKFMETSPRETNLRHCNLARLSTNSMKCKPHLLVLCWRLYTCSLFINTRLVNALHIILHKAPQIYFFIVETYLGHFEPKAGASFSLPRG